MVELNSCIPIVIPYCVTLLYRVNYVLSACYLFIVLVIPCICFCFLFVTYLQNFLGSQNLHVSINKSDITTVPIQFRSVACPLITLGIGWQWRPRQLTTTTSTVRGSGDFHHHSWLQHTAIPFQQCPLRQPACFCCLCCIDSMTIISALDLLFF